METKSVLINHFKVLYTALDAIGGSASLDIKTFKLKVSCRDIQHEFLPQFLFFREGKKSYTPIFSPHVKTFIGWLPYFNKRWELSNEKLKFKEYCLKEGIATPEYSLDGTKPMRNVLVKANVSSFGYGNRGPFASASHCKPAEGEYFESFIQGKILKLWYWNDQFVCMESQDMPEVLGNGKSTLQELMTARLEQEERKGDPNDMKEFLNFMGHDLGSIIPDNQRCTVDYRYGSRYYVTRLIDSWNAVADEIKPLVPQLSVIGQKLWAAIPENLRHNTLYTVDAMQDADNRIWCLEMNSNPFVHPWAYPHILDSLFATANTTVERELPQTMAAQSQLLIH